MTKYLEFIMRLDRRAFDGTRDTATIVECLEAPGLVGSCILRDSDDFIFNVKALVAARLGYRGDPDDIGLLDLGVVDDDGLLHAKAYGSPVTTWRERQPAKQGAMDRRRMRDYALQVVASMILADTPGCKVIAKWLLEDAGHGNMKWGSWECLRHQLHAMGVVSLRGTPLDFNEES